MRMIFYIVVLLFSFGGLSRAYAISDGLEESMRDSLDKETAQIFNDPLPLAERPAGAKRPRFETVHLVMGIGAWRGDYSELKRLGRDGSNIFIPFSIYVYVPFQRVDPSFYFTGGWDFAFIGSNLTFKGMLIYQTEFNIMLGLGAGKTFYSYEDESITIDASQSYAVVAAGVNLSPQRIDLLVTLPVASSLTTNFEESEYTIRPAGIQLSLLVSLR